MVDDSDISRAVEDAYHAKMKSLINDTSILVFGPGPNSTGFDKRERIRVALRDKGCRADYPEDILERLQINSSIAEEILSNQYHLIYVLLAGLGPAVEFAGYVRVDSIVRKFRIFQDTMYQSTQSFLNDVLKPFCEMYGFCFNFTNEEDLVRLVLSCLDSYIKFVMAFRYRP